MQGFVVAKAADPMQLSIHPIFNRFDDETAMNKPNELSIEVIPQSRWMARSTLGHFKRDDIPVAASQRILIAQPGVLKVLAKAFEPVSRDAYYIGSDARRILTDRVSAKIYQEDEIFKAETAISSHLERINEFFDRRIQQAEARLRSAGFDPDGFKQNAKVYEASCTSRTAKEYLDIIKKADLYTGLNEYLSIVGELSDNQNESQRAKLNNEREIRSHLFSITRMTSKHFQIIRRICHGVIDQRREERAKQSERDKRRTADAKEKQEKALTSQQQDMNKLAKKKKPKQPKPAQQPAPAAAAA